MQNANTLCNHLNFKRHNNKNGTHNENEKKNHFWICKWNAALTYRWRNDITDMKNDMRYATERQTNIWIIKNGNFDPFSLLFFQFFHCSFRELCNYNSGQCFWLVWWKSFPFNDFFFKSILFGIPKWNMLSAFILAKQQCEKLIIFHQNKNVGKQGTKEDENLL